MSNDNEIGFGKKGRDERVAMYFATRGAPPSRELKRSLLSDVLFRVAPGPYLHDQPWRLIRDDNSCLDSRIDGTLRLPALYARARQLKKLRAKITAWGSPAGRGPSILSVGADFGARRLA
jgi:hypothetical protein